MPIGTDLVAARNLAARKANEIIEIAVNKSAPLYKAMKKEKLSGHVYNLNVANGALSSSGMIGDGAAYPTASSVGYSQAKIVPSAFMAHLEIPLIAGSLVDGVKDSIRMVTDQAKRGGQTIGLQLERAIQDGYIAAVTTGDTPAGSPVVVDVTVDDASGFREGVTYELTDDGLLLAPRLFVCTNVVRAADGGAVVSFNVTGTSPTTAIAVGDIFWARGYRGQVTSWCSLADAAGSANIYNTTIAASGWSGVTRALDAAITEDAVTDLGTALYDKSGLALAFHVLSPLSHRKYKQDLADNRRFQSSDMDTFGDDFDNSKALGKRMVVSPQCPNKKAFTVCEDAVCVGEFNKGDIMDLHNNGNAGFDHSTLSMNLVVRKAKLANLVVKVRSGVGQLTGIDHS